MRRRGELLERAFAHTPRRAAQCAASSCYATTSSRVLGQFHAALPDRVPWRAKELDAILTNPVARPSHFAIVSAGGKART